MDISIDGERVKINISAPGLEEAIKKLSDAVGPIQQAIAGFIEPQKKSNP